MILQDRVRQYFDKIKDAEDPAKRPCLDLYPIIHPLNHYRSPLTGQLVIDKAAATRFIKNAIAQANDTILTNVSGPATTSFSTNTYTRFGDDSGKGQNANDKAHEARVPAKITEKMLEREKYHEALREEAQLASDEDGEPLDIIDNDDGDEEEERDEGKANAAVASPTPIPDVPPPSLTASRKRRRPPVDPFAGSRGSHWFNVFLLSDHHNASLSQVMAMVQIIPRPVPLQHPLRLIVRQARRVPPGRFEKLGKSTSALRSWKAPLHLLKSIRQGRKKAKKRSRKKAVHLMIVDVG
jgi:hypothetical protein